MTLKSEMRSDAGRRGACLKENPGERQRFPERDVPKISDREFALFQKLIDQETGIYLGPTKRALLVARLVGRLRELRLDSFGAYYRHVLDSSNEQERTRMLDRISTNETRFFREPKHFDFLEKQVFPAWRRQAASAERGQRIRVWSAGCSSGEEPYSLAMILRRHFPVAEGWTTEIVATDLSARALQQAQAAVWPLEQAKEIPPKCLKAFMLKGTGSQAGTMRAGREIRSLVRFERLNLNEEPYPLQGLFDLIFCRNVLIYFRPESKRRVVSHLLDLLAPHGYFFLGHAETLSGLTNRVRTISSAVYALAPNSGPPESGERSAERVSP